MNPARDCTRSPALFVFMFIFTLMTWPVAGQVTDTWFAFGSDWHWRKGLNEVSTPITAWRTNGFNDASWSVGLAPFHYGTNSATGDDGLFNGTILNDMPGNYRCVFLRKTFVVTNAAAVATLNLTANYDDGFIAWINGVEVARTNVNGQPTYLTNATTSIEPSRTNSFGLTSPQAYLVTGTNTLTVQAFNASIAGSDFRFDATLQSQGRPRIVSLTPAAGTTVATLTQVTVLFDRPVMGYTRDALQVNGSDCTGVSSSDGTNVVFTFPQPPVGQVLFYFDIDQTISDLVGNLFDSVSFGSWQVTLGDNVPPQITTTLPLPGASLSQLSQVQVQFNEPVTNVDAGDLLINGVAAATVTGSGAGPYLFQFPMQPSGSNFVSWAGGHGITDLASTPNAFAGGSWSYLVDTNSTFATVVINELLASPISTNGLADEDGQFSDWIELYNRGATAVNLAGWSLTDDVNNPTAWVFPSVTLGAGQYLVVFASGKDRKFPVGGNKMHTNFELKTSGNYLGLYNADLPPRVVSELAPGFPEQRNDISYGYDATNALKYFPTPTPGAPNGSSATSGLVAPVHFSVNSGFAAGPFKLILTTLTPGAVIRYTTDFSEPTLANGSNYSVPLLISNATTIVRAAAFLTNTLPSLVETRRYFFIEDIVNQPANPPGYPTGNSWTGARSYYPMDPLVVTNEAYSNVVRSCLTEIPTLSIVSSIDNLFGPVNGIYTHTSTSSTQYRGPGWERACSAELILPDGSTGFRIDCGVQIQGGSSRDPNKTPKHSFRLNFKSAYSFSKLDYQLFEDSPVKKFNTVVMDAGINYWWNYNGGLSPADQRQRAQCVRDQFVSDLQNATGNPSFHGRFVHVYLNNLYWGICYLHERTDEDFAAAYFGGQPEDYDVAKNTSFGYEQLIGDKNAYNTMLSLANAGLANNTQYETLQQYCDVDNLIDYMIVNLWAGNDDWPQHNWYVARRREPGAGFKFMTWDAEHSLKSVTVNRTGVSDSGPAQVYSALKNNAEFRLRFADHLQAHFFNHGILYTDPNPANAIWYPAHPDRNSPAAFYMRRITEITNAVVAESARWGGFQLTTSYTRNDQWLSELQALLGLTNNTSYPYTWNYFPLRSANVLQQFKNIGLYPSVAAPDFSQFGGRVAAGYPLTMTNNNGSGTIYYTTNGVDPHVYGSNTVAASARAYTNGLPVVLNASRQVQARLLGTNNIWSALVAADFTVGDVGLPLRITEIMYNPIGGNAYEFLEVQNIGALPLDVSGFSFQGITYLFPNGTIIPPGGVLLLANNSNPSQFALRYPSATVFGYFSGSLDNGGERIAILDADGNTVTAVHYDDEAGWPTAPDGGGYSLEIIDPRGDLNAAANWRASSVPNGTPNQPPTAPALSSVVLNEVAADNAGSVTNGGLFPDWIELQNNGASSTNLAGWSLTDDSNARKFVFPANTTVASGGFLVVWCDSATNAPGLHTGFALGRNGQTISLFDNKTNRMDALTYGLQLTDKTVGRVSGNWQLTVPTPNAANLPATLASSTNLTMNEWLANPAPGAPDWVELFNRSSNAPVALRGLSLGTSNNVFQINSLSFVAPRGYVQLFADEQSGADQLEFKLPAGGDRIVLADATGLELERVTYGAQATSVSQGRLPDGAANIITFPGSASPGASNYVMNWTGPILNEVLARNSRAAVSPWGNSPDFVELFNPSGTTVSVAGLGLGTSPDFSKAWKIPTGVSIPANGYLLIWCDASHAPSLSAGSSLNSGFSLSGQSEDVVLFNSVGQPVDVLSYGPQVNDLSLGRSGNNWQLLVTPTPGTVNSAAATLGSIAGLRVNEWMAAPTSGSDWFELYNTNSLPVDLGGLFVTDNPLLMGITNSPIAPISFIGPHDWVKFIADGNRSAGRDHANFSLNLEGETLRLYDTNLTLLSAFDFGLQVTGVSQGSLPDGSSNIVSFITTPTPGAANYLPLTNIIINEVLTHTDPPLEDAIELFNPTTGSVNIGGWYLSDSQSDLKRFRIPDGTTLPANGFKVFYQNQFGPADGETDTPPLFTFNSAHGDAAHVSEANANGDLTGYRATVAFDAAANGISFGRFQTSVGIDFVALSQRTFGMDNPSTLAQFRTGTGLANAYPLVGPVVVEEIMYHPLTATNVAEDLEFLELHNLNASSVPLFDPANATNVWRLANAVTFDFPPNTSIAANGYLLVVPFDPITDTNTLAAFRSRYGTNGSLVGPYSGKLSNTGDTIELWRPDAPQTAPHPDAGFVPYILAERIVYSNASPWPATADGTGWSLQRITSSQYGNDPANWNGAPPSAGSPGSTGPIIFSQPLSRTVYVGETVTFTVNASGTSLTYQWFRNNLILPGQTNSNLIFSAALTNVGNYRVSLTNATGGTLSDEAALSVIVPPSGTAAVSGNNVSLSFGVLPNRSYQLQYKTNLTDSAWLPLNSPVTPTASPLTIQDSLNGQTRRFYRLMVLP